MGNGEELESGPDQMKLIRIATALAATAIASPALAADVVESAPVDPWEFYIGAHAGVVWGHGDWDDAIDNDADLDGSRAIFGVLAGINYRMDSLFLGLEGDIGFATGEFDRSGFADDDNACGTGTWCDLNGHVRLRAGFAVADGLDLFIAGGVAIADGDPDEDEGLVEEIGENDDTFFGWSIGVGADYALTERFKLRVEYLHDDYGNRNASSFFPDYNSEWADNTVRGAAIFTF